MPRHHDAAPSKYQNNVSNTNYYILTKSVIKPDLALLIISIVGFEFLYD
jgi:hypothetical protein